MAAHGMGALGLLRRHADANPEGIELALQDGEVAVFAGDGYEFKVRFTGGEWPPLRGGGSSTGSGPTTSSGGTRSSSSGASRPSGSWSLGDASVDEAAPGEPVPAGAVEPWVDPYWWPPPPGWDPAMPWPPPPPPWAVYLVRRE